LGDDSFQTVRLAKNSNGDVVRKQTELKKKGVGDRGKSNWEPDDDLEAGNVVFNRSEIQAFAPRWAYAHTDVNLKQIARTEAHREKTRTDSKIAMWGR